MAMYRATVDSKSLVMLAKGEIKGLSIPLADGSSVFLETSDIWVPGLSDLFNDEEAQNLRDCLDNVSDK